MTRFLLPALLAAPLMVTAPAAAQDDAGDKVNMVIVYGDDDCPPGTADEIVVCARKAENERFRIPETLRSSDSPQNTAWAERVESFETITATGPLSCSPVGAGGITGCTQRMIDAAYRDREDSSDVRFGRLIEEARAERLSTIDADAAAEQERVEQIEREYLERLEAERAAPVGDEIIDPSAPPVIDQADRIPPAEPSKDTDFDDGDETAQPIDAQAPATIGGD